MKDPGCRRFLRRLDRLEDGAAKDDHLVSCVSCAAALRAAAVMQRALSRPVVVVPSDFAQQIAYLASMDRSDRLKRSAWRTLGDAIAGPIMVTALGVGSAFIAPALLDGFRVFARAAASAHGLPPTTLQTALVCLIGSALLAIGGAKLSRRMARG